MAVTPRHHPGDEFMLDFVAGAMAAPFEVAISSHLALCHTCRDLAAGLEAVGGAMLERLDDAPLSAGGLAAALAHLDEPAPRTTLPVTEVDDAETVRVLPAPLRAAVGKPLAELSWKRLFPGVRGVNLTGLLQGAASVQLLRGEPGVAFPRHRHRALEFTLVLTGGMRDEGGHLRRGDLLVVEAGAVHRPIMDEEEDCYCLVVMERRVAMTGAISRIRQIFNGY